MSNDLSRRAFFRSGALTLLATTGAAVVAKSVKDAYAAPPMHGGHGLGTPTLVGEVNHLRNGFNPSDILTDFDYGQLSELPSGQPLREYEITVIDKVIEIVPGIELPAWTYNGRIPGPTIRCATGDRIRVHLRNEGSYPHSLHFHGIHPAEMDGTPGTGDGLALPGATVTYEFDAEPFGLHLYYSHTFPLAQNIVRGLYGAFIVEPPGGWPAVDREMVMVLNGVDLDFDHQNEFYAVNTIPFHYQKLPISLQVDQPVRIFLINMLEFDLLNTFHLHGNFFHYYPTGTSLTPSEYTDTIMQTQAQRGILEFSYKFPGFFFFRAQQAKFAELGWLGSFQVNPKDTA